MLAGLGLALSACDREAAEPAQEQGDLDGTKQSLSGVIDDRRAGDLLPAINVVDPAGKQRNLGALQGMPVLVNLWATWCAPCVVEMPMLDDLAADMDGELRVLTVSQDLQGAEKVEPFFAKMQFDRLEPWMDPENQLGFGLGGGQLPLTILYDENGQELWRVTGEYDWSSAETQEAIRAALAG
ncbi:TlpA family protein disulfide reductase [Pontixanthobacter sp.]|uniref:TlpA family protein disulfide reductase n=1 Tax=Pontixanthobacter sp. TaxID=2792078 RepID=UPI003C7B9065